ncbi:MAG: ribose-phosphate diphosphokinase [Candidatus Hodarchaeota archaeon]
MKVTLIGKSNFAGMIAKAVSESVFIEVEERTFPDEEVCPRLLISNEEQLKGAHAVIAMQLKACQPKNQYLISLLWTLYNVKRYKPARISCIMPYPLYSRQDEEFRKGEPISYHYLASALESAGVNTYVTFNSHIYGKREINQIFTKSRAFDLSAIPVLGNELKSLLSSPQEAICLAPDEGALFLAEELANSINTPFFTAIQKFRNPDTGEISQKLENIAFEIENQSIVIIDDIVSSGKTMIGAAQIVKEKGAKNVIFAYIHAVHTSKNFSIMQEVNPTHTIATDTIMTDLSGLTTISVIPLLSNWIKENT